TKTASTTLYFDTHSVPTRRSSDLRSAKPTPNNSIYSYSCCQFSKIIQGIIRAQRKSRPNQDNECRQLKQNSHHNKVGLPSKNQRSEEHTSELQSRENLVCRLLLEK